MNDVMTEPKTEKKNNGNDEKQNETQKFLSKASIAEIFFEIICNHHSTYCDSYIKRFTTTTL